MPIYEYRCDSCFEVSAKLRPVAQVRAELACEHCGGATHRIISNIAVHLSKLSKVEKLDPKYDKMVDRAMSNTKAADPERILKKMTPLSAGTKSGTD